MNYLICRAKPEEVRMGLYLALKVFLEFQTPQYGEFGTRQFIEHCITNEDFVQSYQTGKNVMLLAMDNDTIIGMAAAKGNNDLGMLFVDGKYHRKGIGGELLKEIIAEMRILGGTSVTLWATPPAVKFYLNHGFTATGSETTTDGITYTPMMRVII